MALVDSVLHLPPKTDPDLARALKKAWQDMTNKLNNFLTIYNQDTRPVIPDGTMSMWRKSDGTCYIVANFGKGVIKVWGQS